MAYETVVGNVNLSKVLLEMNVSNSSELLLLKALPYNAQRVQRVQLIAILLNIQ